MITDLLEYAPDILRGFAVTLQLSVVSIGGGLAVAIGLALLVSSRRRYLSWPAIALVELGRGAPAIVMLHLVYFGLPTAGLVLEALPAAWLALGITTAAYGSEIFRAGLLAVPRGQREAARALGLSEARTFVGIVLPQALRISLAPALGLGVQMFQATSLAFVISVPELLSRAYFVGTITFRYLEALTIAGVLYALVALPLTRATRSVERRVSRGYAG